MSLARLVLTDLHTCRFVSLRILFDPCVMVMVNTPPAKTPRLNGFSHSLFWRQDFGDGQRECCPLS